MKHLWCHMFGTLYTHALSPSLSHTHTHIHIHTPHTHTHTHTHTQRKNNDANCMRVSIHSLHTCAQIGKNNKKKKYLQAAQKGRRYDVLDDALTRTHVAQHVGRCSCLSTSLYLRESARARERERETERERDRDRQTDREKWQTERQTDRNEWQGVCERDRDKERTREQDMVYLLSDRGVIRPSSAIFPPRILQYSIRVFLQTVFQCCYIWCTTTDAYDMRCVGSIEGYLVA